jgi:hypothetical protein
MKRAAISICLLAGLFNFGFTQEQQVVDKLKSLGISINFMDESDDRVNYTFACNQTNETTSPGAAPEITKRTYSYDPAGGETKYKLNTINGNIPSEKENLDFDKELNSEDAGNVGKPDIKSLTLVSENENQLVVGFRYRAKSLPKNYKFLKDCKGEVYIDKKSSHIEKIKFFNEGNLKYKIFKITKLDMLQILKFMPATSTYVIEKEMLEMDIKYFGMIAKAIETNEYSNHLRCTK